MSTFVSLVQEVETAIASGDQNKRVETLRKMTGLFEEKASGLKELHVAVFDEVILRLARDLEFRARVELSDRLADIENAPKKVVRDLAFDTNIEIARPILERSSRLEDEDLVEIAQNQSQDHLLAMSRRTALSERVTDVLVVRGDQDVVRTVANNNGAQFSEQGFSQLLEKARADKVLQSALHGRADVPANHMARLVEIAREKVRETLHEEFGDRADAMIDSTVDDVAAILEQKAPGTAFITDFSDAIALVERKLKTDPLAEEDVVKWIKDGKMEEAFASIAHLASVPVDMVARAYHATHYDPLLFIVRSIKFSWGSFKLLLTTKAGRMPPLDVLKSAFDSFQQLSVPTAQRVVRFTAAREKAAQTDAA